MRGIAIRTNRWGQRQERGLLVNAMGQPVLADYGLDDLSVYRDDQEAPVVTRTIAHKREAQTITALLDPVAPAKSVWDRKRVHAKITRHGVTREPDVFDEVAEEAIWMSDDAVVIVPLDRLDDFRAWVSTRGMAPCGQGAYKLHVLTKDAPGSTWECIDQAVRPA